MASLVAVEFPNRRSLVWDFNDARALAEFALRPGRSYLKEMNSRGDRLYLDNYDAEEFHEWDVTENPFAQIWNIPGPFPLGTGRSEDGRSRIVANLDGAVVARDLFAQANRLFHLEIVEPDASALSPNGRLLAVASVRGYVRLWEWPSLREVGTLRAFL